jgi:hypothetical protein
MVRMTCTCTTRESKFGLASHVLSITSSCSHGFSHLRNRFVSLLVSRCLGLTDGLFIGFGFSRIRFNCGGWFLDMANRFEFIENVPCSSLTEHHLWLRGCFSFQPTIPFEATPRSLHDALSVHIPLRADACSGCFVLSILCGFVLNSNSNFKSAPLSTSGSELPQLHLGTSKPNLVYLLCSNKIQPIQPLLSFMCSDYPQVLLVLRDRC